MSIHRSCRRKSGFKFVKKKTGIPFFGYTPEKPVNQIFVSFLETF